MKKRNLNGAFTIPSQHFISLRLNQLISFKIGIMTVKGAIPSVLKTADRLFHILHNQFCKLFRYVFSFLLLIRRRDHRAYPLPVWERVSSCTDQWFIEVCRFIMYTGEQILLRAGSEQLIVPASHSWPAKLNH